MSCGINRQGLYKKSKLTGFVTFRRRQMSKRTHVSNREGSSLSLPVKKASQGSIRAFFRWVTRRIMYVYSCLWIETKRKINTKVVSCLDDNQCGKSKCCMLNFTITLTLSDSCYRVIANGTEIARNGINGKLYIWSIFSVLFWYYVPHVPYGKSSKLNPKLNIHLNLGGYRLYGQNRFRFHYNKNN